MSIDFILRLVGMIVFAILGLYWGILLGNLANQQQDLYAVVMALLGALTGLVLTPFLTTRPARALRSLLSRLSALTLVASLFGLLAGLLIAALLAFPLSLLPSPFGDIFPFIGVLIFGYIGVTVFVTRQNDIFSVLRLSVLGRSQSSNSDEVEDSSGGMGFLYQEWYSLYRILTPSWPPNTSIPSLLLVVKVQIPCDGGFDNAFPSVMP